MILVVGATGFLGSEICRHLIVKHKSVTGLIRSSSDPERVATLRQSGVQLVEGDLKDRLSLDRACAGASIVISTATSARSRQPADSIEATDARGQINLVEAARAAGVTRFIYISYSGQIGVDDPLTRAKRAVEQALKTSGIEYTILRPSYFMEFWFSPMIGFDHANAKVTIYGTGLNKISWVSLSDIAEFAAACVDNPASSNAVIELGGPQALSPLEVVRIFEQASRKSFEVSHVPEDALRAQEAAATDSLQKAFAALMLSYAKGDAIPMQETLKRYRVNFRSVPEYVHTLANCEAIPQS